MERDLCGKLGVSRPWVREALRQLEAEGLITLIPHRGPIVATVDEEEAHQLYELRSLPKLPALGKPGLLVECAGRSA